jgi:N-acetylglucosamine-6-phosphate deacetylase
VADDLDDGAALFCGELILSDRLLPRGALLVRQGRIEAIGSRDELEPLASPQTPRIVTDGYISPGYVDLHVHGGAGADFMDGNAAAFRTVLAAHARHGTTSILPTTTVARHDQLLAMLELCRSFRTAGTPYHALLDKPAVAPSRQAGGLIAARQRDCPRVLGAHFYGPYFNYEARGCHSGDGVRPPEASEYEQYMAYADSIITATVAPELPGAESFVRACDALGVRTNVGHSQATFAQMEQAVSWGVRHVDHLYCAMSDKTKLRQRQPFPMQGGVLEATLYFDELTTEVIADGKHLTDDLLRLALKIKGAERLALVTDCNRALDLPEGRYIFGPLDGGEEFESRGGVGVMPDGQALASAVRGMDHMLQTFVQQTGAPLWQAVQMASLTPARIAGWDREIGSLAVGKRADLLLLDRSLVIEQVYIDGLAIS